jgi:hypothetical protein
LITNRLVRVEEEFLTELGVLILEMVAVTAAPVLVAVAAAQEDIPETETRVQVAQVQMELHHLEREAVV